MRITTYNAPSIVNPLDEYNDTQAESALTWLEFYQAKSLAAAFPKAELDFIREENDRGFKVEFSLHENENVTEHDEEIQMILESVFETGNFWV